MQERSIRFGPVGKWLRSAGKVKQDIAFLKAHIFFDNLTKLVWIAHVQKCQGRKCTVHKISSIAGKMILLKVLAYCNFSSLLQIYICLKVRHVTNTFIKNTNIFILLKTFIFIYILCSKEALILFFFSCYFIQDVELLFQAMLH